MSIASEISRLQTAKANLKTSIEGKGVTVPSSAKLDDYADYVDAIQQGGSVTQDLDGYIVLSPDGSGSGSGSPSGIVYLYSDLNGNGVANISQYQYCSVDFAPVGDNKFRYWIDVDSSDLTFQAPVTVPTASTYRYTGVIDWGDGSSITEYEYDNTTCIHTYASPGRYCVSMWRTGGYQHFSIDNPKRSVDRNKIVGVELYYEGYPANTLTLDSCSKVRKIRFSSDQTTVSIINCALLTDVVLPDSLTTIGNMYHLPALESLVIPASVTSISSFTGNTSMKEYHFKPLTPPTISSTTFGDIPSSCVIYVPTASLTAYQTATYWSTYASKMVGE